MIKIGKSTDHISFYSCQPKTRDELMEIISSRISKEGPECDLNDIDTSKITDMSELFYFSDFNDDISKWNVSNVKDMGCMFYHSKFNGDIGDWDVSKVEDMYFMFCGAKFNKDISRWKINKHCCISHTFDDCSIRPKYKPKKQ